MSESETEKLLLVEDTVALADLYKDYLKDEGYDVEHVENGQEAIEAFSRSQPELVLLDLALPDMNGMEVLRSLKGDEPNVIIITAHGSLSNAIEAMQAGAADFLVKPFSKERLLVTVRNSLERTQLRSVVKKFRRDFGRDAFAGFIGASDEMLSVYRVI